MAQHDSQSCALQDGRRPGASSAADKLEAKVRSRKCSHLPPCHKDTCQLLMSPPPPPPISYETERAERSTLCFTVSSAGNARVPRKKSLHAKFLDVHVLPKCKDRRVNSRSKRGRRSPRGASRFQPFLFCFLHMPACEF